MSSLESKKARAHSPLVRAFNSGASPAKLKAIYAKSKALHKKSESHMQEQARLRREAKKKGGELSESGFTRYPDGRVE